MLQNKRQPIILNILYFLFNVTERRRPYTYVLAACSKALVPIILRFLSLILFIQLF